MMYVLPWLKSRCQLISISLLLLSSMVNAGELPEPDYAREQRIAEQIEPDIFDGEAVWLNANDRNFLAIHIAVEKSQGAVILLHGRDVSPEEQELINPLRVGLAERGWTTLALQMPVLEKGKTYYDYLPILQYGHQRIQAAITFLKDQGETTVIIAAHSCGVHMANDWVNSGVGPDIAGYIAMGSGATDKGQPLKTPLPFATLSIPVLDIYGSNEFAAPISMLPERRKMLIQNGHALSRQIEVEGANHYFTGYGEVMLQHLEQWLTEGFGR